MKQLRILFEDEHLVVVDKPAGVLVHHTVLAARDEPSLQQLLRDQIGSWVQPVHRLDRGASGALVFAKDPAAARLVMGYFQERQVEKEYRAVVRGFAPTAITIDRPLTVRPDLPKHQRPQKEPQTALSHAECLATIELPHAVGKYPSARYSWIKVRIETGRLHQIRRHLQGISHPIVGDVPYGDGRHNLFWRSQWDCARLMLFSWRIAFDWKGQRLDVTCGLPADFPENLRSLWKEWGWDRP